jgi:hypothetical protein
MDREVFNDLELMVKRARLRLLYAHGARYLDLSYFIDECVSFQVDLLKSK